MYYYVFTPALSTYRKKRIRHATNLGSVIRSVYERTHAMVFPKPRRKSNGDHDLTGQQCHP
jgi:hypothetical protein